jgi:putative transposase
MARKLRIQYPGATYHVLNRGNYKNDIFADAGAAQAFVATLEEAVDRYGWRLSAYVIMRNHYHLALQTPEPNLSTGMHWLQCTFATRFNRLRKENGHLFQGRFKAILLETGYDLARVVDYIHLNPFRAGIVDADQLSHFRWSSFSRFTKNQRFNGLTTISWMQAIELEDSEDGWRAYGERLLRKAAVPVASLQSEHETLTSGWAMGSEQWMETTLANHIPNSQGSAGHRSGGLGEEILATKWQLRLKQELAEAGKSSHDLQATRKGAAWKVSIAEQLQRELGVPVKWLARSLNMGSPASVRAYMCMARKKINN